MSPRPDIPSLELLVAVADTGSLSGAAALLGLAQPNASRQLARLERRLGTRLIARGARGSEPTAAGRVAVEHARRVLDAADALVDQVQAAAGAGRVCVLASQTIAEHLMPAFLASLASHLPDTPVSFEVANTTGVLSALRRMRADLGFVEGTDIPPGLSSREVGRDRLVAVVAPTHPWAARERIDADELARTPLVVREEGSGTRDVLARALAPRTVAPPALVLHSNAAVRTAVVGGAGCALLSELAVADHVRSGHLRALAVTGVDLRRSLRAVWIGDLPRRLAAPLDELAGAA
ncbi:LysR family transcriptional regulator [Brachybacterium huguangmaarense]|uniref:LysR family transcriptional regulator n=1 Tax=Brachybacterium huguangmaarense TaxID=1652028 RepID=A0ABY6G041_9MICO|nr:LysR family transcriptional regulator [Brachybacterium huguangmaarense]UYG16006.1 LysR family transcriptional regulator [Brachybacterium huguangmaarense]